MDDVDDAPNLDASTYDDRKFIAGFDATDTLGNPQRDGTDDPDDSGGHGTHVAGSALGTGKRIERIAASHQRRASSMSRCSRTLGIPTPIQPCRAFNGSSTTRTRGGRMRIPACEASTSSPCPSGANPSAVHSGTPGTMGAPRVQDWWTKPWARDSSSCAPWAMMGKVRIDSSRHPPQPTHRSRSPLRMTGTRSTGMMTESRPTPTADRARLRWGWG